MFWVHLPFSASLLLHASFRHNAFPTESVQAVKVPVNVATDLEGAIGHVTSTRPFDRLVTSWDDGNICVFLHRDYKVYRCIWPTNGLTTCQKVCVFSSANRWLKQYNETLSAQLREDDDGHAWELYRANFLK